MSGSEQRRLSVSLVDVSEGHEAEFRALATAFEAAIIAKNFGRAEVIGDESSPRRFYAVRHWTSAESAERCHADPDIQAITAKIYQIARVTHVVNGARKGDPLRLLIDDRRARIEADRRTGFERRIASAAGAAGRQGERRSGRDRRLGPRRLRDRPGEIDLVAAARRAREFADAAYSKFKVGAALECADGTVVTGCNVENATYGLTVCAERVAMFKALSEGHRAFTRIAVVADTEAPTPPCGACRQILWEFGGNLEVILANLTDEKGRHQLKNLLPLPFDARLL
ncbi:MAG TPA: cytidine deaminase [Vicinamibacterales bacterium]|nr:cytidine deaminase [Vicinamibacterales bacterium]